MVHIFQFWREKPRARKTKSNFKTHHPAEMPWLLHVYFEMPAELFIFLMSIRQNACFLPVTKAPVASFTNSYRVKFLKKYHV